MKKYTNKNFDNIYEFIATNEYIKHLKNNDINELLSYIFGCEFDVEVNKNGKLNLIDLQGAYLGGIETYENFETIQDACERLEQTYFYDYFNICI